MKKRIEVKRYCDNISGTIYATKNSLFLCDINFNPDNPYFHTICGNEPDGDPNYPIDESKWDIVIVNEFSNEQL